METPQLNYSTEKILNILNNFENILNGIKLKKLSGELYELINVINIIRNMMKSKFILGKNLKEIEELINTHISAFLLDVNNNPEIKTIIDNNFSKPFIQLQNVNNQDNLYQIKYLKYKKKYIELKNQFDL